MEAKILSTDDEEIEAALAWAQKSNEGGQANEVRKKGLVKDGLSNKLFKKTNKKYTMIVFDADERYEQGTVDSSFFVDYPEEGLLIDVVYGDTYEELMVDPSNEGYYYLLYSNETGKRIGSGIVDNSIEDEIHENCDI